MGGMQCGCPEHEKHDSLYPLTQVNVPCNAVVRSQ